MIPALSHHNFQQRGQVATFFVLSFTMFMVFVAMVVNAGLLTRDRIKIQNTADLAALIGANVQRLNLNEIGNLNEDIDDEFKELRLLLLNPLTSSPCTFLRLTCAVVNDCSTRCGDFDAVWTGALIGKYNLKHQQYMAQIMSMVQDANKKGFEYAKKTALAGPNLPVDIKRQLTSSMGGRFPDVNTIVRAYDTHGMQHDYGNDGTVESIADIYRVGGNESHPLFVPEVETRTLFWYKWAYNSCISSGAFDGSIPCTSLGFGFPGLAVLPYRVKDTEKYTPFFMTRVEYSPQYLMNFTPLREFPDPQNPFAPGAFAKAPGTDKKIFLFDSLMGLVPNATQHNSRNFMQAFAAARPFGGKPDDGGYEGAKMIGLASQRTGEIVQKIGLEANWESRDGKHIITEADFLH